MKRRSSARIATIALLILGGFTAAAHANGSGSTVVVSFDGVNCKNPPALADFTTIQMAIDTVPAGSTIVVCPGVYFEDVVVSKTVILKGNQTGVSGADRDANNPAAFLVESDVLGSFTVQAPHVVIDGFTVDVGAAFLPPEANPNPIGITVKSTGDGAVITNNIIDGLSGLVSATNMVGVFLESGPDSVRVTRNQIIHLQSVPSAQGILVGDSTSSNASVCIQISDNLIWQIQSTRGAYGVLVNNGASTAATASGYATVNISDNTIKNLTGDGWAHAIGLEGPTPDSQVTHNTISDLSSLSTDVAAVFFQDNPYFSQVETHLNNFLLPMTQFGIALHADLLASAGYKSVPGTCNFWNAPDGPSGAGNGHGAMVTTHVKFVPFLTAKDGPCKDVCVSRDNDDFDHDGKRKDVDTDDDNDGILDVLDNDKDNDGILDVNDDDDDNDGILDIDDSPSTRQVQRMVDGTVGLGGYVDSILSAEDNGLPIVVRIDSPNAQFLKIEIYDPAGRLLSVSVPTPGKIFATAPGQLLGLYTVRVRNMGAAPIDYTVRMITSSLW